MTHSHTHGVDNKIPMPHLLAAATFDIAHRDGISVCKGVIEPGPGSATDIAGSAGLS